MPQNDSTLKVKIVSPDKNIWEGEAVAVSSENTTGAFDILPGHANFITASLNAPVTIHTLDGSQKKFTFNQLVIYNYHDEVRIYVEV